MALINEENDMKAWYFSETEKQLRFGDNRQIRKGRTHKIKGDLALCHNGLHSSTNILDALDLGVGTVIWRVEVGGEIIRSDNKLCSTEQTYLWGYDAVDVLRAFARKCALDVVHLWDAPEIVVRYLQTGDESVRAAAGVAAAAATGDDVSNAAGDAARAAAWAAARDAAWATAGAAVRAATGVAAGDAAKAAARDKQTRRLLSMIRKGRTA